VVGADAGHGIGRRDRHFSGATAFTLLLLPTVLGVVATAVSLLW
jgi:hypothetical protein